MLEGSASSSLLSDDFIFIVFCCFYAKGLAICEGSFSLARDLEILIWLSIDMMEVDCFWTISRVALSSMICSVVCFLLVIFLLDLDFFELVVNGLLLSLSSEFW